MIKLVVSPNIPKLPHCHTKVHKTTCEARLQVSPVRRNQNREQLRTMRRSTVRGQPWQGQGTKARRKWILHLPTVQLGPSIYHHWFSYKQHLLYIVLLTASLYLSLSFIATSPLNPSFFYFHLPVFCSPLSLGTQVGSLSVSYGLDKQSKHIDCFSCLTSDWTSAAKERHRQWLTNKPNSVPSSSELWVQLYGTTHSWNHLESLLAWLQLKHLTANPWAMSRHDDCRGEEGACRCSLGFGFFDSSTVPRIWIHINSASFHLHSKCSSSFDLFRSMFWGGDHARTSLWYWLRAARSTSAIDLDQTWHNWLNTSKW